MTTKGLVLVTGASGYIAARTVEALLKAGYSVRGTTRSKKSTEGLVAALSAHSDRLEIVEVPDITAPGAYDEAVKGVEIVAHLASPVAVKFDHPDEAIVPAINGTLRALEAAAKEPTVKHFVLMSSIVALMSLSPEAKTYDETHWNTDFEAMVAKLGRDTPGFAIYSASKVAAERAFWKFRDDKKPRFTMAAVNPAVVIGPPLVEPQNPWQNGTNAVVYNVLAGKPLAEASVLRSHVYTDVRDVARVLAYVVGHPDGTDGERYLVSAGLAPAQAIADILRGQYPDRRGVIEEGTPGEGYLENFAFPAGGPAYDGSKVVRLTGQEYTPLPQTILDSARAFERFL